MKIKLLKKIRRRFKWYKSSDGIYVVIDGQKKSVTVIDAELLKKMADIPVEEADDIKLYKLLKIILTYPWVDNYLERIRYNKANRIYKTKKKQNESTQTQINR